MLCPRQPRERSHASVAACAVFVHRSFGLAGGFWRRWRGWTAVCRAPLASQPCPAAFEEAERRVRESVNALGCEVLGAWIESLDDGALRVDRAGQRRVPGGGDAEVRCMSTLGPVTYRRARYRNGVSRRSLVPVDESLGLVNDWLTQPGRPARAADDGPLHSAGSGGVLLRRWAPWRHRRAACNGSPGPCMSAGRAWDRKRWRVSAAWRVSRPGRQRLGLARRRHGGAARRRGWARRSLLARGRLRHGLLPRRRRRTAQDPLSRPHCRRAANPR